MSDSIFNFGSRPRRRIEPQMPDENSDPGDQSDASGRRDPGVDSLNELARMIADPVSPAAYPDQGPASGGRLADVSRTAASGRDDGFAEDLLRQRRPFEGRSSVRREPDFARSRLPVQPHHPDTDHAEAPADNLNFLQLPDRDDYAVAPRHPMPGQEDNHDRDQREGSMTGRRHSAYGRQADDYADDYRDYDYDERDEETEYGEHDDLDDRQTGAKKRGTSRVVVAVLGLAVFGTAAAFGYRTIVKTAPSDATSTPIIRADKSPSKITPVAADANAKPARAAFADRSKEQLIARDEEPVAAPYGAGTADSSARGSPALPGDPKRVRTVPIRADQNEASSSDRSASRSVPPPQSQPRSPPPPAHPAAAAPPSPAPSPPRQVAAVTPPSTSPGDARGIPGANVPEAAASRATEAGGFVVQLSAARSEADAQASFRTLQGKYPALSGREPLIRRRDLGDRGIFFATQVGPFGVKSEADQLCDTLKGAGAACFVQKN